MLNMYLNENSHLSSQNTYFLSLYFKLLNGIRREEYYLEVVKHEWEVRRFSGSKVVSLRSQYGQNCRNGRKRKIEVLWIECNILQIFNTSGEMCYGILICFRKLFWGLFFGRCIWGRFCFGKARGSNTTGINSVLLHLSQFNTFFQFLQSTLYPPPALLFKVKNDFLGWYRPWKTESQTAKIFTFSISVLEGSLSDLSRGYRFSH